MASRKRSKPAEELPLIGLELSRQGRIEQLERYLAEALKALEDGRRGDAMKALRAARGQPKPGTPGQGGNAA